MTEGGERVVAADGNRIKRYDLRTRQDVGVPLITPGAIPDVAFTAKGDVAAVMTDVGIQLWSVERSERLGSPLRKGSAFAVAVAFNPAGTVLAAAGVDQAIQLWDVAARRPLGQPLPSQAGATQALAFSADGTVLASAGTDRAIRLWDATSRRELLAPLEGHSGPVLRLAWSPRGKLLASASRDGTVRLWDLAAARGPSRVLSHDDDPVADLAVGDGVLASTTVKGRLHVWDLRRQRQLSEAPTRAEDNWPVAFSADGRTFASAGPGGVRLFDVMPSGTLAARYELPAEHASALALSSDGSVLAMTAGNGQDIQLWDARTRRRLGLPLAEFSGLASALAFSSDGRTLAAATTSGVQFWNVRDQRVGRTLRSNAFVLNGLGLSDDGRVLATIGDDAAVRIWDAAGPATGPAPAQRRSRWVHRGRGHSGRADARDGRLRRRRAPLGHTDAASARRAAARPHRSGPRHRLRPRRPHARLVGHGRRRSPLGPAPCGASTRARCGDACAPSWDVTSTQAESGSVRNWQAGDHRTCE